MATVNEKGQPEKKSVGEISIDAQTIINRLEQQVDRGDGAIIPYSELNGLIGRDVQHGARGILATARGYILRERQVLVVVINGEGVRMADNEAVVAQIKARNQKSCNNSRRAAKESIAADVASMTDAQRHQFLAAQSVAGTIALMTKPAAIKKIEAHIGDARAALPTGKILEFYQQ